MENMIFSFNIELAELHTLSTRSHRTPYSVLIIKYKISIWSAINMNIFQQTISCSLFLGITTIPAIARSYIFNL